MNINVAGDGLRRSDAVNSSSTYPTPTASLIRVHREENVYRRERAPASDYDYYDCAAKNEHSNNPPPVLQSTSEVNK